jgi:hypothetical protein
MKRRRQETDMQEIQAPPAAQLLNRHIARAEWDDPADTGRTGSYARVVYGFRRHDVLITLHRRSPLEFTRQHLQSVERLRDDHEIGEGVQGIGRGSGGQVGPTDARLDAVARYRAAVQAVGWEPWAVLRLVAIDNQTLGVVSVRLGLQRRPCRRRLIDALDRLTLHYNPVVRKG